MNVDNEAIQKTYAETGSIRRTALVTGATYHRAMTVVRAMAAPAQPSALKIASAPSDARRNIVHADKRYERIAFLSDMHHPFHDGSALRNVVFPALRDFRPQLVILGGDQFDCYSISDHDREPGRMDCLQDEFDAARDTWRELADVASRATVVWIDGNHEERIRRIQARNPGLFKLRAMELPRAAELPKRWLYYPNQTRYRIGSLSCHHGDLKMRGTSSVNPATGMLRKLRTTSIFGHLHRFQSSFETTDDGTYRGGYANGHLCDVEKADYITNPDWQEGFSLIEFDWSVGIFKVSPQMIVGGHLILNGKTYGPTTNRGRKAA